MSQRFDCPELGYYNMTDEEMIADLKHDAARGDRYAAACLHARGIDSPEGVETHSGSTAQPQEPACEATRPEDRADGADQSNSGDTT